MEMAALGDGGDGVGDPDRPAVEVADGVADVDATATATDVAAAVAFLAMAPKPVSVLQVRPRLVDL